MNFEEYYNSQKKKRKKLIKVKSKEERQVNMLNRTSSTFSVAPKSGTGVRPAYAIYG